MITRFAFVLVLLVIAACENSPEGAVFPRMVGHWEWVHSEGGYDTIQPLEKGYRLVIEFSQDGRYTEVVDGRPVLMAPVDTGRGRKFGESALLPTVSADSSRWFSRYGPCVESLVVDIRDDTIMLTPAHQSHAYTYVFRRVEPRPWTR